jgi:hypothetical protein
MGYKKVEVQLFSCHSSMSTLHCLVLMIFIALSDSGELNSLSFLFIHKII